MKNEIVKKALDAGILLTPTLLETIDDKKLENMISEARKKDKPILTEREPVSRSKIVVKIIRVQPKERLTPEDFAKYYSNKYEGIKNILLKKLDAVSINKVGNSYSDVSVIGMVRDTTQNGFILEDPTGEIEIVSNNEPMMDDVIGVKGSVREGKIVESEIVLPDIPLENPPKTIRDISILLTTAITEGLKPSIESSKFVLVPKTENNALDENDVDKILTDFTNPTTITISSGGTDMRVLVYKPDSETDEKQTLDYMRKRHLSPGRNMIIGKEDCFLIDPIPDIFWIISKKRFLGNYKGVTIISCESPDAAMINLGTRAVEFKQT